MTRRPVIVIDTETTGLDPHQHVIVELAAINLDTGEELVIVPTLTAQQLGKAEPKALTINRYYERRVYEQAMPDWQLVKELRRLREWLDGATLAGVNPTFDAAMLAGLYRQIGMKRPGWHFRLAGLAALTAGALGPDPLDLPGLGTCCTRWSVTNEDPHSALGDARATAECLRRLREHHERWGESATVKKRHLDAMETTLDYFAANGVPHQDRATASDLCHLWTERTGAAPRRLGRTIAQAYILGKVTAEQVRALVDRSGLDLFQALEHVLGESTSEVADRLDHGRILPGHLLGALIYELGYQPPETPAAG